MEFDGWTIAERPQPRAYRREGLYASLNSRGEIVLSERAYKKIWEPASVTLLWDAEHRRIGVKFPLAGENHFFFVRRYGRGRRLYIIRASKMMRQFGIEITETVKFPEAHIILINQYPMLVLDLNTAVKLNGVPAFE